MSKDNSIKQKYAYEWTEIDYILKKLENETIYDHNGNIDRAAGSLHTNGVNLRKQIDSLLFKIDNDIPGDLEGFKFPNI
ncbi:hypothetical protein ACFP7A_01140 [Sporolactobacillus kofuensis]|uniref:Uncharacterized protein n=1 Tax=Sporolactobacillus kofuensis TaxID=269672 RepID=A0ABW1W9Z7_9BACL|nr:hypothetical protein [Sporolactobacillus kofuensis]MCO7177003.1 hypothetical protein [Sporolactobacillus kofuensis]